MEDEGLWEKYRVLRAYFESDPGRRFQLEGPIGEGADSVAWGVQRLVPGQGQRWERIILKTPKWADLEQDEVDSSSSSNSNTNPIENEKHWLRVLRWAKHVANILDIPADPLRRQRHGTQNWIYLEWVQHGTLHRLIKRAKEENVECLPNRLLWRFFMCLIRMCIAMAWPPAQPVGRPNGAFEIIRQAPPLKITHGDLHSQNVMIGGFEPNSEYPEHDIAPVLKMIDLGEMSGNERTNIDATKQNIYAIGNLMHELCTLLGYWERSNLYDGTSRTWYRPPPYDGPPIQTEAVGLLLQRPGSNSIPLPGLDPDLRLLILACLAVQTRFRPNLADLYNSVLEAILTRHAAWYTNIGSMFCNPAMETNRSITSLLQLLLRDTGPGQ